MRSSIILFPHVYKVDDDMSETYSMHGSVKILLEKYEGK
jgi:hypothetical protein